LTDRLKFIVEDSGPERSLGKMKALAWAMAKGAVFIRAMSELPGRSVRPSAGLARLRRRDRSGRTRGAHFLAGHFGRWAGEEADPAHGSVSQVAVDVSGKHRSNSPRNGKTQEHGERGHGEHVPHHEARSNAPSIHALDSPSARNV